MYFSNYQTYDTVNSVSFDSNESEHQSFTTKNGKNDFQSQLVCENWGVGIGGGK